MRKDVILKVSVLINVFEMLIFSCCWFLDMCIVFIVNLILCIIFLYILNFNNL